jgi:hypothetical protein
MTVPDLRENPTHRTVAGQRALLLQPKLQESATVRSIHLQGLNPLKIGWRITRMGMNAGHSVLIRLEAQQKALEAELVQIDREIQQEQEALARIETKVRSLEKANRQAA